MLKPGIILLSFLFFFLPARSQNPVRLIQDDDLRPGQSYTWHPDTTYLLDGLVYLESGGSLRIEAGTVVKGKAQPSPGAGPYSALVISRSATIRAMGSPQRPVVFTAEQDDAEDPSDMSITARGLWGGLVLLGNGRINDAGSSTPLEGLPAGDARAQFGGTDDTDNSGLLSYVSIRHAGAMDSGVRLAGLTLAGVGSGTALNHVEAFSAGGDGIRLWGGTAALKYVSVAFCGEDQFDWDYGWRGKGIYWFSIQAEDMAGYAINGRGGPDAGLFSNPQIYNLTLIGAGTDPAAANPAAIYLHDNSAGRIANSIFSDFPNYGIEVEDLPGGGDSRAQLEQGHLQVLNNYWWDFGAGSRLGAGPEGIIRASAGADDLQAAFLESHLFENGNLFQDPFFAGISRVADGGLMPNRLDCQRDNYLGLTSIPNTPFFAEATYTFLSTKARGAFPVYPPKWWWIDSWVALEEYVVVPGCGFYNGIANILNAPSADTFFVDCATVSSLWLDNINDPEEVSKWGCPEGCPPEQLIKLTVASDRRTRRKLRPTDDQQSGNRIPGDVCFIEEWQWKVPQVENEYDEALDTLLDIKYFMVVDTEAPEISLIPGGTPGGLPFTPALSDCDTAWIDQFAIDTLLGGPTTVLRYNWVATDYCGNTSSLSVLDSLFAPPQPLYQDLDSDGYGNPEAGLSFTTLLPGYSLNNTDCDDRNPNRFPGAPEDPFNAIDDNCDGEGGYDHCPEAIELQVDGEEFFFYSRDATPFFERPLFECSQRPAPVDIWFRARVPQSGNLGLLLPQPFTQEFILEAYRGDCENLQLIACDAAYKTNYQFTSLLPGEEVLIRVGMVDQFSHSSSIRAYDFGFPSNDECFGAIFIPPLADTCIFTAFPFLFATHSFGVPNTGCRPVGAAVYESDLWLKTIVPPSGFFNIQFSLTGLSHEVFSGSCSDLNLIACNPSGSVPLARPPGEELFIRVVSFFPLTANVCIQEYTPPVPLANDDCDGAIPLVVGSCDETVYSMAGAAPAANVGPAWCGAGIESNDAWFQTTIPASGNLIVDVYPAYENIYLNIDAIQLYQGDSCGSLVPLACSSGLSSVKLLGRSPGSLVFIRLSAFALYGQAADFKICAREATYPPAYDLCENAQPLLLDTACLPGRFHNFSAGLTPGLQDTGCGDPELINDTWFTVTVPPSGQFIVEGSYSFGGIRSENLNLELYSGSCNGLQLAAGCGPFDYLAASGLEPGGQAYIRVSESFLQADGQVFSLCAYDTTGSFLLTGIINGGVQTENGDPLEGAILALSSNGQAITSALTDAAGQYALPGLPAGAPYLLAPSFGGPPAQGATNLDLLAILRHHLGIRPLGSPYKLIAADLNEDQAIDMEDITLLNQAILGSLAQFPNGRNWRFVDATYVFPDPTNPWLEAFPEAIVFDSLGAGLNNGSFVAVKLGDVNGTALDRRAESAAAFTALEPQLLDYLRDNPGVAALSAYPNPVLDNLQVSWLVLEPGPVRLDLFSADGRRLKQLQSRAWQETGIFEEQYDIGVLPGGLYFLRLESPDGVFMQKIINFHPSTFK